MEFAHSTQSVGRGVEYAERGDGGGASSTQSVGTREDAVWAKRAVMGVRGMSITGRSARDIRATDSRSHGLRL